MSTYFKHFPEVLYKGKLLKNIARKTDFSKTVFAKTSVFLPYTIEDDDRPEDVAFYYYGDMKFTWLVYLSNNIVDPYYEWPLTDQQMQKFLIKKYAEVSGEKGKRVISWTKDTTITNNILHYENKEEPGFIINKETFTMNPTIVEGEWYPIRYYEYEITKNENRRSIILLDRRYRKQAETEMRSILSNVN